MKTEIEKEFDKMILELQGIEEKIQELNTSGIRVNEELLATIEILKTQINRTDAK
jgi:hypothetical protein